MSKPNKAELIYVNSVLQGCIQEWLDNPPVTTYDALNAAFRRKFDQLEKDTQRLLAPPAPRKPKSRVQDSKPQAETVSSEPIARYEPSGEYVNPNAKRGRNG